MVEPWGHVELPDAVINAVSGLSCLATILFVFLPGWLLTRNVKNDWARVALRAGVVAMAFAPALFLDPGGITFVIPASLGIIGHVLLYTEFDFARSFYFQHTLFSLLMVWFLGIIVGGVSLDVRKKGGSKFFH